jgi:SAM-dependent methyltransferase
MTTSSTDRRFSQTSDEFVAEDLKQMAMAPNYSEWLYRLIAPFIGKSVLEIGSGTGTLTSLLLKNGKTVTGIEPNPFCIQELSRQFGDCPRFHLIPKPVEACTDEELKCNGFESIVSVNVLEHIEEDQTVLNHAAALLPSGGRLALIIPACPKAYGTIDQAVGHFRRYSVRGMRQQLTAAGLRPLRLRYSNALGLAGWYINGRIRRNTQQNNGQIRLFNALTPTLAAMERIIPPPLGLSLTAIAEKT